MLGLGNYQDILNKLEGFIRKYYTKQLVKGIFLFLTLGLLFWLGVITLEYVLWLNTGWRLTLLLLFIVVETYLLYRYILVPVSYLFHFKKGIDNRMASQLIGKHFPEVDDKLLNLLELSNDTQKSDLLLASIEQRAQNLRPIPFSDAVNLKDSYKYAKYVLIPIAIIGFIWVTGDIIAFFNSNSRVVHYDMAFERPAPFTFKLLNESLEVMDNEPLTIRATTFGEVRPESISIVLNGEPLIMKRSGDEFTYTITPPVPQSSFYLSSDDWTSRSYNVSSYATPSLLNFQMAMEYPRYLNRPKQIVKGTGNATVPEGTIISWKIKGSNVDEITLMAKDTTTVMSKEDDEFYFSNKLFNDLSYEITTSNEHITEFEKLAYRLEVVKDANPTVTVEQFLDSLNPNQSYYTGQAADDYGLSRIRVVCYPSDDTKAIQRIVLESPRANVHQFYYTFPSGFDLEDGRSYKLYFEVVDNDGVRGGKVTKSQTFNALLYSVNELKDKELEFQNSTLTKLGQTLDQLKDQNRTLQEINKNQKEEQSLSFEDKNNISNFLKKQEQQENLMKKFSQDLKQSLDKDDVDSKMKKMLQERLERQELEAKRNAALLKELQKVADKIDKEELQQKLDELGKNQGKNTRNLEQILELTKRYYVTEKASQIGRELDKLAERQKILSDLKLGQDFTDKEQRKLNETFDKLEKDLQELQKDNNELKKPLDLDVGKSKTDPIKADQKVALDEINKQQGLDESSQSKEKQEAGNNISKKQKSAAQKIQELSDSLSQGAAGGAEAESEDAEMLRQILDNVVRFSFKQENLFDNMQTVDVDLSQFSKTVKEQQNLRRLFEHVDDSLFALSLRRAEIAEFVNEQITEVYYNIDKALESIAENQVYQGASYQQYVINASNALADFLANTLDNMQQSMQQGQGGSDSPDFQLPDIIKGQQDIQGKMQQPGNQGSQSEQQGNKKGEEKGQNEGTEGDPGKGQNDGSGKGDENGKEQKGNETNGSGNGLEEMNLNEVYEIYKEQQYLRQQLEDQLQNMIKKSDQNLAEKLIQQMEDFENDLLENGITERTRNKANNIQHELMKLENASLEQGKKMERESSTGQQQFKNAIITKPELLKDQFNNVEILNRQALPLRQNFERKVKLYFNND